MGEWREKGRIKKERERERKTERSCIGPSSERTVTRVAKGKKRRRGDERRKGRKEENAVEDGRRGGQERGSRRTGRINKRNAPPSHLRHLYFAAPRGRKSSSVSERGDTAWRGEARRGGEQKGRQGVPRVKDHGHLPRARAQRSSLTLSPDDTSAVMTARDRQIRGRKRESSLFFL